MKILVAVKRVVDPYVKIRVKSDQTGIEKTNIKMAMNPFDEIALEQALRLREQSWATEVVIVSIGEEGCQETLRHGLALGADRAIFIKTNRNLCSLNIAKILQHIVINEQPDLVLLGKQSIDGDNNQTPQMLAGILNWPQALFASHISVSDLQMQVTREIDGGTQTLSLELPAIVSTDLRLNTPRYATLPNIMKAKQKPLVCIELDSLKLGLKEHIETIRVTAPLPRSQGIVLESVTMLIDKLRNEAKVI